MSRVKNTAIQSGGKTPCKKILRSRRKVSNNNNNNINNSSTSSSTEIKQDTNKYISRNKRNAAREQKQKQTQSETHTHTDTESNKNERYIQRKAYIKQKISNNRKNGKYSRTPPPPGRGKLGPRRSSNNNNNNTNNINNSTTNASVQRDRHGQFAKIKAGSHGGKVGPLPRDRVPARRRKMSPEDHDRRDVNYDEVYSEFDQLHNVNVAALEGLHNSMNDFLFTRAHVTSDANKLMNAVDPSMLYIFTCSFYVRVCVCVYLCFILFVCAKLFYC